MQLRAEERGIALGYAASGWVAGYQEGFGRGFDAAMEAHREFDEARKASFEEGEEDGQAQHTQG